MAARKSHKSGKARKGKTKGNGRDVRTGSRLSEQDRNVEADLVFLPLGGAGEIGLNAYLYGYGPPDNREWILVDLGVSFADEREPGIDVILPDLSFLEENKHSLLGIVITHGHEDHYGALAHLWRRLEAPVYATAFTKHLLQDRLKEYGLDARVPVTEMKPGQRFTLGPFEIEPVAMTHSIPEPMGLAIRTPLGNLFHTGDWKIDSDPTIGAPFDPKPIKALGEEGCLALICDSTNAMREGVSDTETQVAEGLEELISKAKKRVAVTTFASNLGRVIAIAKAAEKASRTVVVAGRAMWRMIAAGRECGYLDDVPPLLDIDAFDQLPRENVVLICTGSQGEPRAALARIAEGRHGQIELVDKDIVIFSSRTIPGNEKSVSAVQNNLARLGVEIITDADHLVHSSGHPRRGELEQLYGWLDPEIIVPMHGEARHLRVQAKFASEKTEAQTLVAENGEMVRLAPGDARIIDEAPAGRLHVDGSLIVPSERGPASRRRKLSFAGLVAISLVCDKRAHLVDNPQVEIFGLPDVDADGNSFEDLVLDMIDDVLDSIDERHAHKVDLAEVIERAVRRECDMIWRKKPVCKVFVHRA